MKLSIIIPVYRVEATLDRCIESVLHQDIDDFEVILVDDGSPDNCPKMCDDWAHRDAHIRVIHQANGGLSAARNAGIDATLGEYITFVDSDDYISPDTYASLIEDIGTADIIEYPVYKRLSLQDKEYSNIDRYWLETKAYAHTYACNKVYRSSLFADVRFPVGRVFEDAYTFPLLLRRAHSIITTSKGCYHYRNICRSSEILFSGVSAAAASNSRNRINFPRSSSLKEQMDAAIFSTVCGETFRNAWICLSTSSFERSPWIS